MALSLSATRPNSNHTINMATAIRPLPAITEKNKRNFFKKVSRSANGCHDWTGSKNSEGRGFLSLSGDMYLAPRIAYMLHFEVDPGNLNCLHACDNPSCVNPDHLFLGSQSENVRDCMRKSRRNSPRGERQWSAKLKASDIHIIRADCRSVREIADRYGVTPCHISKIKRGCLWAHI